MKAAFISALTPHSTFQKPHKPHPTKSTTPLTSLFSRHWMGIMGKPLPPQGMPGVLLVKSDSDYGSVEMDYSITDGRENLQFEDALLFSPGSTRYWLVRMDKPGVDVVTMAQMVDFYAQILTKVVGNLQDAQMCIYHVSWQSNFGFCCVLDEQCARELAGLLVHIYICHYTVLCAVQCLRLLYSVGVPGVLSVEPDDNYGSENKNYGGISTSLLSSYETNQTVPIDPKKLFVTGLSFYTSEKTLRTAFEGFGELVEVKVILDKITKRSKGYAFVKYTTEEAARVALKEMNGKIINGWIIVVNYAKENRRCSLPRYIRGRSR